MALQFNTIAKNISQLTVAGAKIYDIDEIPNAASKRRPSIIPLVDPWISDLLVTRDSQGGSTALQTVMYTLRYRLCHTPVGSGRGLYNYVADMVKISGRFLDAVLAIDTLTGSVTVDVQGVLNFGVVNDPSESAFYGTDFELRVMEFVN